MDPQKTLNELVECLDSGQEFIDPEEHCENLYEWLSKGGFPPNAVYMAGDYKVGDYVLMTANNKDSMVFYKQGKGFPEHIFVFDPPKILCEACGSTLHVEADCPFVMENEQ